MNMGHIYYLQQTLFGSPAVVVGEGGYGMSIIREQYSYYNKTTL